MTRNDGSSGAFDLDTGPNGLQNFPESLAATVSGGSVHVTGTLPSNTNTHYTVEFFASDDPDGSGYGEGAQYLGATSVLTDGVAGTASIDATLTPGVAVAAGSWLTATATAEDGSTSEFSEAVQITPGSTASVSIPPEADTFVSNDAPTTNFGTQDFADTYGGFNSNCVPLSSPAYTLMRFDLSAIPAGAHITHVELDTTTRAGWAQDGDPAHWAIFIPDDTWSETGVTWDTRPPDGLTSDTLGDPAYADGPDIRQSSLALGGADVWRNGCGADPDPAGNQTKTFPSTDDGFDRTVAQAETGFVDTVKANNVPGDDKLSLELWTPNCPMCPSGADKAYWARYYTREATDPAVRPKLVITYDTTIAGTVDITADAPTVAAGAAQVKLNAIPPSLFFNAAGRSARRRSDRFRSGRFPSARFRSTRSRLARFPSTRSASPEHRPSCRRSRCRPSR